MKELVVPTLDQNIEKYLNGIDIIYWINLERSIARNQSMTNILSKFPIHNIRINAVDGKNISDENLYSNFKFKKNKQQYRTNIDYACLLSHLNTIKEFSESKYQIALIMEDDISMDFLKYWDKSIENIIKEAPDAWEIIMLNYTLDPSTLSLKSIYTFNMNGDIWGAGAYIIKKSTAIKFMSMYQNSQYILDEEKKHTADNYIFSSLVTFIYKYPYFTYPDNNDSTIHTENLDNHMVSKKKLMKTWDEYYIYKNKEIIIKYINGFDIIYWINLDRSKDRFNSMTKMLNDFPVKNIRISATDGKYLSDDEIYGKYVFKNNKVQAYRSKIEYACLLSHLTTIKTFNESEYEIAMIMEDDVSMDFIKYWKKSITEIITNAPTDWEVIMLNYIISQRIPDLTDIYTLNKKGFLWGAGTYLINKKGSQKLMSMYDGKYNLDEQYKHTADDYIFSALITYTYKYPYFTYPDENDSTIHAEHLSTHIISKNRLTNILENYIHINKSIIDEYFNGIDIIYWINLERSIERCDSMMKILDLFPVKNIKIKAIDGVKESIEKIYNNFDTDIFNKTNTEYACLLSHLKTIKQFSDSSYETCLILEDDMSLEFVKYWNESIKNIISNAPKDWEILMLTYITDKQITNTYTLNNGDIYSSAAYVLNKKSANKFIKSIYKNNKYVLPKDSIHTADEFIFSSFKTYTYKYAYFIYPDNNDSTIHNNHLEFHMFSKKNIKKLWVDYYNNNNNNYDKTHENLYNVKQEYKHDNKPILKIIIYILLGFMIYLLYALYRKK